MRNILVQLPAYLFKRETMLRLIDVLEKPLHHRDNFFPNNLSYC